jgi:DNA-binding MurR/RpiR family transcriptional regulator
VKPEQTFDDRVASRFAGMSEAEQRVARFFQANREEVLMASAATLASKAGTSDATVIRTTKSLGFSGLDALRRLIATELRAGLSPADRMENTLQEVGDDLQRAFGATLDIQTKALVDLRRNVSAAQFRSAVTRIVEARRVVVFGIGPSSALADYMVIQLGRFGLDAVSFTRTGLLFADDLNTMRKGDVVVMLAYGRVYAELAALLDKADEVRACRILLTDTLSGLLRGKSDIVLAVARGRVDMLSMHTATLGLLEALLVGVASQRPRETIESLKALNVARAKLAGKPMSLPVARKDER